MRSRVPAAPTTLVQRISRSVFMAFLPRFVQSSGRWSGFACELGAGGQDEGALRGNVLGGTRKIVGEVDCLREMGFRGVGCEAEMISTESWAKVGY